MKNKILVLALLVVIIVGAIFSYISGFNFNINLGKSVMINIYMTKEFAIEDINQIAKEVLNENYEIKYTDEFSDAVSIRVREISEEQKTALETKLKEKYEFSDEEENVIITEISGIEIYELIKDYIKPVCISLSIILIYYIIAFRKLGIVNSLVKPLFGIILIEALYVSVFAISRISINEYTIPFGILIYVLSFGAITICLKKKLDKENLKIEN